MNPFSQESLIQSAKEIITDKEYVFLLAQAVKIASSIPEEFESMSYFLKIANAYFNDIIVKHVFGIEFYKNDIDFDSFCKRHKINYRQEKYKTTI